MAKRLNYTIGVDADTSKLEASLNDAFSRLNRIGSQVNLTTDLRNASQAALELSSHLNKAFNQQTGKFDLVTFNQSLSDQHWPHRRTSVFESCYSDYASRVTTEAYK